MKTNVIKGVLTSALTIAEGKDKIDFITKQGDTKQFAHLYIHYLYTK
jgi:hypothetical protein